VFHIFSAYSQLNCSLLAWLFELAGGAIPDYEDTCIPKSQREASFTIAALHQWEMEVDDDRCKESAEEVWMPSHVNTLQKLTYLLSSSTELQWIADTLQPVHIGGSFPSVRMIHFKFIDRLYMDLISSLDGVSPLIGSKLASEITGNDFTRSRLNMTPTIYSRARFGL